MMGLPVLVMEMSERKRLLATVLARERVERAASREETIVVIVSGFTADENAANATQLAQDYPLIHSVEVDLGGSRNELRPMLFKVTCRLQLGESA
jgi:hypothetical protein